MSYPKTWIRPTDGEVMISNSCLTDAWLAQNGFLDRPKKEETFKPADESVEVEKVTNEELEKRRPGRPRKWNN